MRREPELLACRGGNVVVRNVSCLGGHGASIGGVRHGSVTNVTFQNMTMTKEAGSTQGEYTTGGLRVKSYPNSTGTVSGIRYRNIVVKGVFLPLQLLGHYCPWPCRTPDGNTSVLFDDILFENVRGTGSQAQHVGVFSCSALAPCGNITLVNVSLAAAGNGPATVECVNAPGVVFENSEPSACSKK